MKKGILASLFHVASSAKNVWHDHCPKSADSWCGFQRDIINKTGLYKPVVGLLQNILETYIKPIYADLSDDKLLNKCLHGKTQNANESFNAMIWDRVPKSRYCGFAKMELGIYDAVGSYFVNK